MLALVLAAVYDPEIRVLHALQALMYVGIIWLAGRSNPWGFGAGCLIAAFWNYTNLFVTDFIKAGIEQLGLLIRTGEVPRPDLLVSLAAAGGHFILIVGCVAGQLRMRPTARQWGEFVGGGVIAVGYLILIIITTGQQYIPLVKRVFGM